MWQTACAQDTQNIGYVSWGIASRGFISRISGLTWAPSKVSLTCLKGMWTTLKSWLRYEKWVTTDIVLSRYLRALFIQRRLFYARALTSAMFLPFQDRCTRIDTRTAAVSGIHCCGKTTIVVASYH